MMKNIKPLQGSVSVVVVLHPPDKRKRDLDNILKATLDALEGYAYVDDCQISRLEVRRAEVVKGGSVVVSVDQS
jgi:crossover junction endodeoxyribonuclease RusA